MCFIVLPTPRACYSPSDGQRTFGQCAPRTDPTWQFAVITNANENLQTIQPMNNLTRNARSILSWALPPTGCNYTPIWGNALNYRIRLDQ